MTRSRIASTVLAAIFATAATVAWTFPSRARTYPLVIATAGLVLSLLDLVRRQPGEAPVDEGALSQESPRAAGGDGFDAQAVAAALPYLGWILALMAAIALVGFVVAACAWVALFLNRVGQVGVRRSLAIGALIAIALLVVGNVLGLYWPGALFDVTRALRLT